jgi:sirohydrochlorin cobaltochelatase
MHAVVLFAHGSRDPLWSRPIQAIAARMQALAPAVPVRCAYLELTEPDLATVVLALAADGATSVSVVPMFLGVGRHARHDLPELVRALAIQHPHVRLDLQPAIGEHPLVVDLMARIALGDPPLSDQRQ